jgi:hypothetical protein
MRRLYGFVVSAAVTALVACGDSSPPADVSDPVKRAEREAVWEAAEPIIEQELSKEESRSAVRFPCTLYDQAAASALMNAALDAPNFSLEHRNEDADSWSSVACSWNSLNSGPDLSVWVSRPDHFDGGAVRCFGLEPEDNAEPELGARSSWWFQEAFGWSRLRGCGEGYLFQVEIMNGPTDDAAARGLSTQVGQRLVEILAGAVGE